MEDNDIVALLWERQEPALAHLQDKYSTYLRSVSMMFGSKYGILFHPASPSI